MWVHLETRHDGHQKAPRHGVASPTTSSDSGSGNNKPSTTAVIVAVVIIVIILILSLFYLALRYLRSRNASPRFLPGTWLKQRWLAWTSTHTNQRGKYMATPHLTRTDNHASRDTLRSYNSRLSQLSPALSTPTLPTTAAPRSNTDETAENERVDRHTSVRSIMTLPAYHPSPRPTETVLGRAGERAGIDTVVEFPETGEEEEDRREEQMESLYQIREARRREQAAREERRRQRREARDRGDWERVRELRVMDRLRREEERERERIALAGIRNEAGDRAARELVAEHRALTRERERRISSVSYADLGVARHDGTRLRAGSAESDRRPLLDNAAATGRSRAPSSLMLETRNRDRSTSVGSGASNDSTEDAIAAGRARAHSRATSSISIMTRPFHSRSRSHTPSASVSQARDTASSVSNPQDTPRTSQQSSSSARQDTPMDSSGSDDIADARPPPQYDEEASLRAEPQQRRPVMVPDPAPGEEAPPYESPTRTDAPRLPGMARLPAIDVTLASPVGEGWGL